MDVGNHVSSQGCGSWPWPARRRTWKGRWTEVDRRHRFGGLAPVRFGVHLGEGGGAVDEGRPRRFDRSEQERLRIGAQKLNAVAESVETFFHWRPSLHDQQATVIAVLNRRGYGDAPTRFGIEAIGLREFFGSMTT